MTDAKRQLALMLRRQTLKRLTANKLLGLSPGQLRAARGLLHWSQSRLATAALVTDATIRSFEVGRSMLSDITLAKVHMVLEEAGILFLKDGVARNGEAVVLRPVIPEPRL